MPVRTTSVFEPTGWPVSTCSSTRRRRIVRCLLVRRICILCRQIVARRADRLPDALGEQLGRDAAAEEPPARGQPQCPAAALGQAEPLHPRQGGAVERVLETGEGQRL